jgi:FAD-dependent fumarate reductase
MAEGAQKHIDFYHMKGLLTSLETSEVFTTVGGDVKAELENYTRNECKFGKKEPAGLPLDLTRHGKWYLGKVTPVVHYTMGGVAIDTKGRVLTNDGNIVKVSLCSHSF